MKAFKRSMMHALHGFCVVWREERNIRIHSFFAIGVLVLGVVLGVSRIELTVLFLTIGFVFSAEILNSILERLVDITRPRVAEHIRIVKDMMAAFVLCVAVCAAFVGFFIFLPSLARLFTPFIAPSLNF